MVWKVEQTATRERESEESRQRIPPTFTVPCGGFGEDNRLPRSGLSPTRYHHPAPGDLRSQPLLPQH